MQVEQGSWSGDLAVVRTWRRGLLVTRWCEPDRAAQGVPVVVVVRARARRLQLARRVVRFVRLPRARVRQRGRSSGPGAPVSLGHERRGVDGGTAAVAQADLAGGPGRGGAGSPKSTATGRCWCDPPSRGGRDLLSRPSRPTRNPGCLNRDCQRGRGPEKQPLDSVRRVRPAAVLVDPPGRSRAHRANALPPLWSLVAPQPVEGDDALSGHARVRVGGTHAEADAVIWCTGFRPPFPTSPRSNSAADVATSPPPAPARWTNHAYTARGSHHGEVGGLW